MRRARWSWPLAGALLATLALPDPRPLGVGGAEAAPSDRARPSAARPKKKAKRPKAAPRVATDPAPKAAFAPGFAPAENFAYRPAFSAALHPGATITFATVINPLRSQEFPATPEYSYLYVSSPVLRTAPTATPYSYVADNRALLSPSVSARAIIDAYSWRRTWLNPKTARANGLNPRTLRPSNERAAQDEIADSMKPNAMGAAGGASSELNSALRSLRLPAQ